MEIRKTKFRGVLSGLAAVAGIAFLVAAYSVDLPEFESLSKRTIILEDMAFLAAGRTYPKFKIIEKDGCEGCYFYSYNVKASEFSYLKVPQESLVEVWIEETGEIKYPSFAWQVVANGVDVVSYESILELEMRRVKYLLWFGMGGLLFSAAVWLFSGKNNGSAI